MKKIIPAIILAIVLVSCGAQQEKVNQELHGRLAETTAVLDSLQQANDELTAKVAELESYNYWYDDSFEGDKLTAAGIEDPETYIGDQLRENPELIPTEAILGGTMFFWNVQLLGKEWVIADYTDGHVAGKAIYRYQVDDKGGVKFSLMANQVD